MTEPRSLGELLAEAEVLLGPGSHWRIEDMAARIGDPSAWALAIDTYRQRPARSNPLAYFARVLESKAQELDGLRKRQSAAPEVVRRAFQPPQGFKDWEGYYAHLARWRRQHVGADAATTRAAELIAGSDEEEPQDGVCLPTAGFAVHAG